MNYRYYINNLEVFPTNKDSYKFEFKKRVQSGVVFDKVMNDEVTFKYDSGNFNFKDQEELDKCEELSFVIKEVCGDVETTYYESVFSVMEGEFDDVRCEFKVKPRPVKQILDDVEINFLDDPIPVIEGGVTGVRAYNYNFGLPERTYANARYFENVLLFVAQKANPNIVSVISNFFQINPDNVFYLPITNWWTKMVFCNLSDVQEPIPSNLSTFGAITFKDLMDDLEVIFGVQWTIDSNFNLRVEHESWFDGIAGLNLTSDNYLKYIRKKTKYNYSINELPKQEIWKIAGNKESASLTYTGVANTKKGESSKTYQTRRIQTDYRDRMTSGGSEEGLFLFATNGGVGTGGIWYMLQGDNVNLKLMPGLLVQNLHTYNRPSLYAIFKQQSQYQYANSSGGIILESKRPNKEREEISFPLCCDENFEPNDVVETELGDAYVDKASFDMKGKILSLNLKYMTDECNFIEPNDLDGLALWLKYNDHQKTGNFVDQWNDSSGNNRHATATGSARPLFNNFVTPNVVTFSSNPVDPTFQNFLTTPAFQLFPNKRGTIFLLTGRSGAFDGSIGEICVLSTNGGAGTFFDISLNTNNQFISVNESLVYPQNYQYPTYHKGLYTLRRFTNTKIKTSQNSVPSYNNSLIVANTQPSSNPLIIGHNSFYSGNGQLNLIEVIIYDRELSDYEVEQVEFYLVKKGIYNIYP